MKRFFIKNGRLISMIFAIGVGLLLIVTATFMLTNYQDEISERAISRAQYNTVNAKTNVYDRMGDYEIYLQDIVNTSQEFTTKEDLSSYLNDKSTVLWDVKPIENIKTIRYYKGDKFYNMYGGEIDDDTSRYQYTNNKDQINFVSLFYDTESNMSLFGFYFPVENSQVLDALVIYYTADVLSDFYNSESANSEAYFSILVDADGKIWIGDPKEFKLGVGDFFSGNMLDNLRSIVGKKSITDEISKKLYGGKDDYVKFEIGTEDYILTIGTDKTQMHNLALCELYSVSELCASGLSFVNTIISIIIIFTLIVISLIVYLVVYNISIRKKLLKIETTNTLLMCNNRNGFEKEAKDILDVNLASSYFACMVLEIRHFQFIKDTSSEAELNSALRYIKYALSRFTVDAECYGYNDEGEFLCLLHAKDREGLIERLKVFNSVISKNRIASKLDILIKYGIYEVDSKERLSISRMIDYAHEANNTIVKANAENAGMQFNFYDVELRNIRLINEDMELRMESALKNGEFQVFYQPKYNLNLDRQDGAEALVRWYDKESGVYNRPDLFMSLFESNGFVVKIDKYVFERVCEYINYSIAHGRQVYPVSVNISRVTAIQPDFVEYYTRIKRKYGIADGQIMIEFTESFAYENYKFLYEIVDGLHKAGFKCSIDDFGCGYSSYRILKSLPMDEIKLDKFFMDKGLDQERDNNIFESIIKLAKKLKMKVTQEGVEEQEGVELLRKMNCDVIQGYIYAHPMALSDYIKFVEKTREHNLK